jgi:transcriptional regulator with XRE-family HTH domain
MALSARNALNLEIGGAVRKRRNELGYSLEQLSALTGVSRAGIANYESGKASPGIDKLIAIAHVLGMRVEEMLPKEYEAFVDSPFLRLVRQMADSNAKAAATPTRARRKQQSKKSDQGGREGGFSTTEPLPAVPLEKVA